MKSLLYILSFVCFTIRLSAQCNAYVNNFPYYEPFEVSDGNWITGGTLSDWTWGRPAKPVIQTAATGSKCWITGGISKSSYNDLENAWLKSPCFDFSKLKHPYIAFNIFWETERKYDGVLFQYSTDYGNTWNTVGGAGESQDCFTAWWYNDPNVMYLDNRGGWSGNVQSSSGSCLGGGGSDAWLNARHTLSFLAGYVTVTFRFLFASGATCNDFDGFAVDDIYIGETTTVVSDFSYTCGNNLNVSFTSNPSECVENFLWNFGDTGSGANNTAISQNTTHIFSSAGTFAVTLKTIGNNDTFISVKNISIIDASITQTGDILCNGGNTASASVNISGSIGPFTYLWNTTSPQTTGEAKNLSAGIYSVIVQKDDSTCPANASITITEPAKIIATENISQPICLSKNGSITLNTSGGIAPYTYAWQPAGSNANMLSKLDAGIYSYTISDKNNCTVNGSVILTTINNLHISLGSDTTICPGDKIILSAGNFVNYLWQDNSTSPTFTVLKGGTYSVIVTDNNGCGAGSSIRIEDDCGEIFFPNAFTPNGDYLNDGFGPLGNRSAITNYTLHIYNRLGQLVFQTTDPFLQWYGATVKQQAGMTTYVWIAKFDYHDKKGIVKKGTVLPLY